MTLAVSLLLFLKVVIKYAYRSLMLISNNYSYISCNFNSCCGLFKAEANLSESEHEDNMDVIHDVKENEKDEDEKDVHKTKE